MAQRRKAGPAMHRKRVQPDETEIVRRLWDNEHDWESCDTYPCAPGVSCWPLSWCFVIDGDIDDVLASGLVPRRLIAKYGAIDPKRGTRAHSMNGRYRGVQIKTTRGKRHLRAYIEAAHPVPMLDVEGRTVVRWSDCAWQPRRDTA